MKVLCTGAAGYVGGACLRYLIAHGHDAIAFDNLSEGHRGAVPQAEQRLIVGDLADTALLKQVFQDHSFDAVMHFAAVASVPESIAQPALYWQVNAVGTKNLLDAMLAAEVKNLVFSSTAAVYAHTDQMPITEDSPIGPITPYGTTKRACEQMIEEYRAAYGLGYTIMRYFNASGADTDGMHGEHRQQESHLIPIALQAALGIRPQLTIYGDDWPTRDGTCVRDYVHVADIAQAHVLAMNSQKPGVGRTFNIGSNAGNTVREVVDACQQVSRRHIECQIGPRRPGDPANLVASNDKLRSELGWEPSYTDIEKIVATAYAWHERHPRGYDE